MVTQECVKTTVCLVGQLCSQRLLDTARDVVGDLEEELPYDVVIGLLQEIHAVELLERDAVRASAVELLGDDYTGPRPGEALR